MDSLPIETVPFPGSVYLVNAIGQTIFTCSSLVACLWWIQIGMQFLCEDGVKITLNISLGKAQSLLLVYQFQKPSSHFPHLSRSAVFNRGDFWINQ